MRGREGREREEGEEEEGEEGLCILVLGLGGGVIPTFLIQHLPNAHVHVVELVPDLVQVAHRFHSRFLLLPLSLFLPPLLSHLS